MNGSGLRDKEGILYKSDILLLRHYEGDNFINQKD